MWPFTAIPAGWFELNGQQLVCVQQPRLFLAALADLGQGAPGFTRGTAVGNPTFNPGTNVITLNSHGLNNNDIVHFANSGGALPSGLTTLTAYYVINSTTNTFQVSLTQGGSVVSLGSAGTGTNSVYNKFQLADGRSRSPMGAGQGTGLTNRTLGLGLGEETHLLLASESGLPAHAHNVYNDPTGAGNFINTGSGYNRPQTGSTSTAGPANAAAAHNVIHPSIVWKYLIRA